MAMPASSLALLRSAPAPAADRAGPADLGLAPLSLGEWDVALPDGGLPRGVVLEVASPCGLARSTSLAVAACAAAQRASGVWSFSSGSTSSGTSSAPAWCAWIDPWGTLNAPGVRDGGVDLERLLVVRPTPPMLARAAVRVASSRTFAVVVVDTAVPLAHGLEGTVAGSSGVSSTGLSSSGDGAGQVRLDRWPTVVRRLALAVEGTETTVLVLTDLGAARGLPLPVAMRLELDRRREDDVDRVAGWRSYLRVAKDRHGRVGGAVRLGSSLPPRVGLPPRVASATPRA
jgi:hypothetical protein